MLKRYLGSSLLPYLITLGLGTVLASVGTSYYLWKSNTALSEKIVSLNTELSSCKARVTNLKEDAQSDATVTDPKLFDVPDHWMFEAPGNGLW